MLQMDSQKSQLRRWQNLRRELAAIAQIPNATLRRLARATIPRNLPALVLAVATISCRIWEFQPPLSTLVKADKMSKRHRSTTVFGCAIRVQR